MSHQLPRLSCLLAGSFCFVILIHPWNPVVAQYARFQIYSDAQGRGLVTATLTRNGKPTDKFMVPVDGYSGSGIYCTDCSTPPGGLKTQPTLIGDIVNNMTAPMETGIKWMIHNTTTYDAINIADNCFIDNREISSVCAWATGAAPIQICTITACRCDGGAPSVSVTKFKIETACNCPALNPLPLQNGELTHRPPILSFSGIPTLADGRVSFRASGGVLSGSKLNIDIQSGDVQNLEDLATVITDALNASSYVATKLPEGFLADGVTPAAIIQLDLVTNGPDQSIPDTIDTLIYHSATEDPQTELDVGASLGFSVELGLESVPFHRGDVDDTGSVNIADAIRLLEFMFLGLGTVTCMDAGDADDNGELDITDAVKILAFIFLDGPEFPPPGAPPAACGLDGDESLSCFIYTNC
jgi:hypothetical protein